MKYIIIVVFLMLFQISFSQQIINGFSLTTSNTSNGQRILVSNQGQNLLSNDTDSFISYISAEGINNLYNYNVIDAFIDGLYRGTLPIRDLKLKGDFGIGAPDMLDGELVLINGKAYQTKATGETTELDNDHLIPFASVTFFKADTTFILHSSTDINTIQDSIEVLLPSKNKMYAIKISGKFEHIKTRAFPLIEKEPFPKLVDILDRQRFFNFENTEGTLIGFLLPNYLNGLNAGGYHFHFLSKDKKQGGHILEFNGKDLKVELATLKTFVLDTPNDKGFLNFEFKEKGKESLKKVEQGKE